MDLTLTLDEFLAAGTHNVNEMVLDWEEEQPVVIADDLYLTEYKLVDTWVNSSGISYTSSQYHYGHFGKLDRSIILNDDH